MSTGINDQHKTNDPHTHWRLFAHSNKNYSYQMCECVSMTVDNFADFNKVSEYTHTPNKIQTKASICLNVTFYGMQTQYSIAQLQ